MATPVSNTRRDNVRTLLLLPVKIGGALVMALSMLVGMVVLMPVIFFVLGPVALMWMLSLPVGIVSPTLGHRMADTGFERAGDLFDRASDLAYSPSEWIRDKIGLFD